MAETKSGQAKKLPRRLRLLRKSREVSFRELSRITGINHTTLCYYEKGSSRITAEHAHLLAEYYGVDVSEFWRAPRLADRVTA